MEASASIFQLFGNFGCRQFRLFGNFGFRQFRLFGNFGCRQFRLSAIPAFGNSGFRQFRLSAIPAFRQFRLFGNSGCRQFRLFGNSELVSVSGGQPTFTTWSLWRRRRLIGCVKIRFFLLVIVIVTKLSPSHILIFRRRLILNIRFFRYRR